MRRTLVTVASAGSLLLVAAPLVAQGPASPLPGALTLTPHIGLTTYSDIAKLQFHDDGSDPSFPYSGTVAAKLDGQLTFGVSGNYQPLTSRWGGFADYSRSGGDARFTARSCDPDFGCDSQSFDAEGSQWRASAGVTRRFTVGALSSATLAVGGVYAKTHFEGKNPDDQIADLDESSPGVVVGGSLDVPVSPRIGIRFHMHDAVMHVSGSSFARDLNAAVAGSGTIVEKDDKFMNALNFGAGLVLHW